MATFALSFLESQSQRANRTASQRVGDRHDGHNDQKSRTGLFTQRGMSDATTQADGSEGA
jgi:hypothetical protein